MGHNIPDYDWEYAHQEWGRGLAFYEHRLRQIGFHEGTGLVLDAGCGTGQWMDALYQLGREVVGVDVRRPRLEIASIFLQPKRTHLIRASIEALPFREGLFTDILCYGVIMFTNSERSLVELSRISKEDGRLYICWNALGWSLHLLLARRWGLHVKVQAIRTILNTLLSLKGTKYISKKKMQKMLNHVGFYARATGGEGLITLEEVNLEPKPVYRKKVLIFDNVLEILAVKKSANAS